MSEYLSVMSQAESAPYEEQIRQAERIYNTNKTNLTSDNQRALRELYVGRMNAERDLPQRLSAYGMNGGLTETSELDLRNNYLRNRSNQETDFQRSLADLTNTYQGETGNLRAQIAAIQGKYAAQAAKEAAAAAAKASAGRGGSSGLTVKKVSGLYEDEYRYYDANGNLVKTVYEDSPNKTSNLNQYGDLLKGNSYFNGSLAR